ncbi:MAG: DUF2332 domain-containing protein [Candidatus Aquilonibacter sp.]
MIADPVVRRLEQQVEAFATMGSSLYARITMRLLGDYRARGVTYDFFTSAPERAALSTPGVRLLGALHYLALSGEAPELAAHLPSCGGDGDADAIWENAQALLVERAERIGTLFAQTPQTNEVARATVLLAGLCAVARETQLPIRLFEIGASAGLNSRLDRYRYEGDGWAWGDAKSPLVLRNRTRSGTPSLVQPLVIAERAACDLHPLDVRSAEDRTRLLSFVWSDQAERFARLRAAFEVAQTVPLAVERADMFAWLVDRVASKPGTATVVMHSVMTEHLTKDDRARLAAIINSIGATATSDAPFATVNMEFGLESRQYETRVTLWPGAQSRLIAGSDGHAQGIEWIA